MISRYANKVMDNEYNMFMSIMHVSVSKHLWDEHFTVIWANDYFYELIGYGKEEYTALFHNHVDEYYKDNPQAVAAMAEIIAHAFQRGEQGYEFECEMPTKSGKLTWIRVTGRFTDEVHDGFPVIYTIYTDITQLKEMQLRLEEALRAAEGANRAKSDFLSRMSHDIRTPMNAIVGMTEIASASLENPDKVRDCLKKIALSSQHLLGLINDVLDMSKIESGNMRPNIGPVFLPELMENVVTIVQPDLKMKAQRFSIRLHDVRHEHFYSDALRLRQVFINILSNACKFTPEGGSIAVAVRECGLAPDKTADLEFIFTDTGIGMKPEFVEKIFDVFTRERDSRVDKTEGSGLGMAISKKIVDMLGGSISVQSRPGWGAAFTVRLPLRVNDTVEEDLRLPPVKILVIDDEEAVCAYIVHVLETSGARAEWTTSGLDALSRIERAHTQGADFDAVLLDWRMPDADGMSTAWRIRELRGESLPILMISAYDWGDIEEEVQKAGVGGFLSKPLFPSTLIHSLRRLLAGERAGKEASIKRKWEYNFTGYTFLLVEDNQLNLEIARELLSFTGATIESARDGVEGLEKFAQSPVGAYDLVLMDIQMPKMDGYTAARRMRELPRPDARAVPILAMTADAFTEDIRAAKAAGMDGHLAKPLDMASVNRTIAECLDA